MSRASEVYAELFKSAMASPQLHEVVKTAAGVLNALSALKNPYLLGGLAATGLAAGVPAYYLGRNRGRAAAADENETNRALAFGGGLATGLAAPKVFGVLGKATGLGLSGGMPTGEYGEFATI